MMILMFSFRKKSSERHISTAPSSELDLSHDTTGRILIAGRGGQVKRHFRRIGVWIWRRRLIPFPDANHGAGIFTYIYPKSI